MYNLHELPPQIQLIRRYGQIPIHFAALLPVELEFTVNPGAKVTQTVQYPTWYTVIRSLSLLGAAQTVTAVIETDAMRFGSIQGHATDPAENTIELPLSPVILPHTAVKITVTNANSDPESDPIQVSVCLGMEFYAEDRTLTPPLLYLTCRGSGYAETEYSITGETLNNSAEDLPQSPRSHIAIRQLIMGLESPLPAGILTLSLDFPDLGRYRDGNGIKPCQSLRVIQDRAIPIFIPANDSKMAIRIHNRHTSAIRFFFGKEYAYYQEVA
jgi:hypothetical protein